MASPVDGKKQAEKQGIPGMHAAGGQGTRQLVRFIGRQNRAPTID